MGAPYTPRRGRASAWAGGTALLALVAGVASACGSKAVDVDGCKQIEAARCQAAPACSNVSITPPYYTSGTDVAACIRYYDIACLDGLEVSAPTAAEVSACIASINTTCAYVAAPQDSPACAWLSTVTDAGATVDATDAADVAVSDADAAAPDAEDSGD